MKKILVLSSELIFYNLSHSSTRKQIDEDFTTVLIKNIFLEYKYEIEFLYFSSWNETDWNI